MRPGSSGGKRKQKRETLREKKKKGRRRALNFLRVFFVTPRSSLAGPPSTGAGEFVASAFSLSWEKVRLELIHQARRRAAQLFHRQRPPNLHPVNLPGHRAKAELVIL